MASATQLWSVCMEERDEEQLVLQLTAQHLRTTTDWPTLGDLHKRINRELKKQIHDVGAVARRLDRHPFLSGYHDLSDAFAPRLEVLGRVPEGEVFLDATLAVIRHAHAKYMSSSDGDAVKVSEREVIEELGLDTGMAKIVRKLLDRIPWVIGDREPEESGWAFGVSDLITRWDGVEAREDLVESLEAIEDYNQRQAAAMSQAKADMVRATQRQAQIVVSADEGGHWYETPLAKGIAWAVGVAVGVLSIIVLVQQL